MGAGDLHPLNLRQLGYWVAVVEEGSLTTAARRLSISQPALSQQVRALERTFGGELLERLPTGVRPTAAGRDLLPEARAAIAAADRALRTGRRALALEPGTLEIATIPTVASGMLFSSLRKWHERYPAIPIRLREFTHRRRLEQSVAGGVGDMGLGTCPQGWSGPLVEVGWDELVAILPPDDPLVHSGDSVALPRLATREWVLYDSANGLADFVAAACRHAGFEPRGVVETSQVDHASRLAAAGLGAALVPAKNVTDDVAHAARRLDPPLVWKIAAYTRTRWSKTARTFVAMLQADTWPAPSPSAVVLNAEV